MYLASLVPILCLPAFVLMDDTIEASTDTAVADVPVTDTSYSSGLPSFLKWTSDSLHAHHEAPKDDEPLPKQETIEERSFVGPHDFTFGWAAGTAVLIFAFANTVIIGSTLMVTYTLYQVLVSVLAVVAPNLASVFASLFNLS
eukprot:GFUD01017428.1.p1 GENE.GFUD01017428.1~~GFUD01017428.1.p1  ORF type:complete len:143 (-),score=18.69 GFUD01017428.1:584-1012(-)